MTKYKSWMWRRKTDRSVCPVSGHTVVRVFPSQNLSGFSFCGFQPRCSADLKTYFVAVGHMVTLTFFSPRGSLCRPPLPQSSLSVVTLSAVVLLCALLCAPSGSRAAPVSGRFSVPCPGSGPSDFSCLPSSCWESFMVPPHTFFLPFPRSLYSVYWPLYVSPCGLRTPRSAAPPGGQWAFKDFYVPFPCSP